MAMDDLLEPSLSGVSDSPTSWAGVEQKLSFWGAVSSLSVSMLGTGIVAFPYGFALCGYIAAPVALILMGMLAYLSYKSLVLCTARMRVASYGGLVLNIPRGWGHYTNIALWLLLVLATAAYVIISAHIICGLALNGSQEVPLALQNGVLFAIILAAIFPLCLLESLHGLSGISAYCSCAIVTVVGLVVWQLVLIYLDSPPLKQFEVTSNTDLRSVVLAVPLFGCAMFGHMNISQIYAELQPRDKPRANTMALVACGVVVALYMAVGVAGYAAFGSKATDDVVAQIAAQSGESGAAVLIQGLLASFIVLKTPLLILPLRNLTLALIAPERENAELSRKQHVGLTFLLLACVYVVAVALPDLSLLLEILGAMSVVPLTFVVPARLSWAIELPRPTGRCLLLAIVGVVASVLSMVAIAAS